MIDMKSVGFVNKRHRVELATPGEPTIWLAEFYSGN
jgi:hypothetical protein